MKALISVVFVLLLIIITTDAGASGSPFGVYAGGGLSPALSPEDFTDLHHEGQHFFGGLVFQFDTQTQLVWKVEYHSFSKDFDEFFPEIEGVSGATRHALMFGVDARLTVRVPTLTAKPFLLAGVGLVRLSESNVNFPDFIQVPYYLFESRSEFYLNLGGGLEFKFLKILNIFFQVKLLKIYQPGDDLAVIPVSLGVRLW